MAPRDFKRSERVAGQLRRDLAKLIQQEIKDPDVGFVSLSDVEVTRDLSHAKVYFTCMGSDAAATAKLLNRKLAGFLRHELAQRGYAVEDRAEGPRVRPQG